MNREPLGRELAARIDELEEQVDGLRKALACALVIGLVLWLDMREAKAVKPGVD
jgi:hypothetical protein